MDGLTLLRELRQTLSETSTGTWLDAQTSYDYLYRAAVATSSRVNFPTKTQDIITVADQEENYLNGDFLKMFRKDENHQPFVRLYDGTSYYWLYWKDYDQIILENNTTSVTIPTSFSIIDAPQLTQITGVVSANGAASGGECTLTKATAGTDFANVFAGDIVHNTTDVASGIIISRTSATALVTCLFGGSGNDWTSADAFIINPQNRFYLWLDPPPSTAAYTVRVWYVAKPTPVYSSYRSYPFPTGFTGALVSYAAWLYKYRDSQPNFADTLFKYWDMEARKLGHELNHGMRRTGFTVDFKKN